MFISKENKKLYTYIKWITENVNLWTYRKITVNSMSE